MARDRHPSTPTAPERARDRFWRDVTQPPAECGVWPFWFWNDDLDEAELVRQLHAFHAAGAGGVLIHPRIGLSARIGYLTPEYFRLVRRVVDECATLDLGVLLYDEGSYPSGSAGGRVVAANPDHAARALVRVTKRIERRFKGYWRPSVNRSLVHRLVSVTIVRLADPASDTAIDPNSLERLVPEDHNLVRIDVPDGRWLAVACFDVPSGGVIRGVLPEHEDDSATAPPAGDIMNPDAVASFIHLTHDAYAAALGDHVGRTVVGMFTDEPSPMGRRPRRDAWPYTAGFDRYVAQRLDWPVEKLHAWLPALWLDYGAGGETFRRAYTAAVERRIGEVFYGAQADWCEAHGIALTGHPHSSNDMASLRRFHWPGQDAVWRWVAPPGHDGDRSGIEGPHSVSAKAATSSARAYARRRVATELFGAYGWRLSLDEAKWLIDWHLARGNNLFIPHAFFYSVRGARAFESEPDLALHNTWWRHFQHLMRYTRAMSWLLTDCEHVCDVAVLGTGHALPWRAARQLYESQIDFLYIDDAALAASTVRDGALACGTQKYRVIVRDGAVELSRRAVSRLSDFGVAGGALLDDGDGADIPTAIRVVLPDDVRLEPPQPQLRVVHVRKRGLDVYALFNEGEAPVAGSLAVAARGAAELFDPLRGVRVPVLRDAAGRIPLRLDRRESRVLVIDPAETTASAPVAPPAGVPSTIKVIDGWSVATEGASPGQVPPLGDWTHVPELERFSGTVVYTATVALDAEPAHAVLDLGRVAEAAEVSINDRPAGFALWSPYRVTLPSHLLRAGDNRLSVGVTNSAANHYEGALLPSGLLGPVELHVQPGAASGSPV